MVFDRKITAELQYLDDISDDSRVRASLSYTSLNPRMDTFPIYATTDANGLEILEGYQVFHSYKLLLLAFGVDYRIFDRNEFYGYGGFSFLTGGADQEYDLYYERIRTESFTGGRMLVGLQGRAGLEKMLSDDISIYLEFATNAYYMMEEDIHQHNEIGLGVHVMF